MESIKVLIVEDELLIAKDIHAHLEEYGYHVTGIAFDYEEAIENITNETPDIVLLDINLNGEMDGFRVAEFINKNYDIPFVYITSYGTQEIIAKAKHTRPTGYLVKPFKKADIFSSIEIGLFSHASRNKPVNFSLEHVNKMMNVEISTAEFRVLQDVYDGKTNKQISQDLNISINTVKTHLSKLYNKLDVKSRAEAIARIREFCS